MKEIILYLKLQLPFKEWETQWLMVSTVLRNSGASILGSSRSYTHYNAFDALLGKALYSHSSVRSRILLRRGCTSRMFLRRGAL